MRAYPGIISALTEREAVADAKRARVRSADVAGTRGVWFWRRIYLYLPPWMYLEALLPGAAGYLPT